MRLLSFGTLLATLSSGCYVYTSDLGDDGYYDDYSDAAYNFAPEVIDGEAGCYYDPAYNDDVWFFDAYVDDLDGLQDITQVWADVYDEFDGSLVESFELYPTNESLLWFSDWLGSTTYLSCGYSQYTVDLVAYDTFEDMDYITVVPYVY